MSARETGGIGRWVNELEESLIAIILGLMTMITFANVIARYVFNSNLLWALELTVFLFAWLVLLGMSYAVKTVAHLGVDVLAHMAPPPARPITRAACLKVYMQPSRLVARTERQRSLSVATSGAMSPVPALATAMVRGALLSAARMAASTCASSATSAACTST